MESLRNHFLYEKDLDNASELFESLFRQLKIIHSNNMIVPNMNSDEIMLGGSMSFNNIKTPSNFQAEKRKNIVSLAKIMIGSYLSVESSFKDFSSVDDEWFINNFDSIFDTLNYDDFDKEYFSSVLLEGNDYYYSDYLDRKRQSESLQGKSNIQGYKKVLRNAGSSLYEDLSEIEPDIKEKNANMKVAFNPLLIGLSIAVFAIVTIMLVMIH